mgnify:CR=1 FL=1
MFSRFFIDRPIFAAVVLIPPPGVGTSNFARTFKPSFFPIKSKGGNNIVP